ncbi:dephospho-CoA kinase [bacterium]|nr:dephospho-CoA kinase [bacterium]
MQKVAIVGNIASGKTAIKKFLVENDYKVLDTDVVTHKLQELPSVISKIVEKFSGFDILENDKISRVKLGKIVFSDKTARKKLESILHPLIRLEIDKFFLQNNKENIVFVEIPLLFEANMADLFNKIIFVKCDVQTQIKRLQMRNNLSKKEAQQRINSQMPQDCKIEKSDIIIDGSGTLENLYLQLKNLSEKFN